MRRQNNVFLRGELLSSLSLKQTGQGSSCAELGFKGTGATQHSTHKPRQRRTHTETHPPARDVTAHGPGIPWQRKLARLSSPRCELMLAETRTFIRVERLFLGENRGQPRELCYRGTISRSLNKSQGAKNSHQSNSEYFEGLSTSFFLTSPRKKQPNNNNNKRSYCLWLYRHIISVMCYLVLYITKQAQMWL